MISIVIGNNWNEIYEKNNKPTDPVLQRCRYHQKIVIFPQNKCGIRNYDTFIIENHLFDIFLERNIFYEFVEL